MNEAELLAKELQNLGDLFREVEKALAGVAAAWRNLPPELVVRLQMVVAPSVQSFPFPDLATTTRYPEGEERIIIIGTTRGDNHE